MMLKLKLQYFGHLMWRVDSLEIDWDWGQEEKGMTEDEMAGWHHWLDGRESEWTPGVGDGQGGLACCDSWGRKESDMTEWLNWTEQSTLGYVYVFSVVQLCPTLWTFCDTMDCSPSDSLSMGFSRQEYWSGLPFPAPGDLPDPGIKPVILASPALAGGFFTAEPPGKPLWAEWLINHRNNAWSSRGWNTEIRCQHH